MSRSYGRVSGERGTHFVTGEQILEVVHTEFMDNNRAQYRYYGGERSGQEFDQTAEHFKPLPKDANCPTCGAAVYTIFDHVDQDCEAKEPTRQFAACKFRIGDTRTFTYANDGPPVKEGDIVRVPDRSGAGWKKVYVVSVTDEAPPFECKPILGLHTEEPVRDLLADGDDRDLEASLSDR